MWINLALGQLDVVFISYDEPEADANYAALLQLRPDAVRVHGVKGFDAAHRAAAHRTKTEHVITIDGDNLVTDADFLNSTRAFTPHQLTCMISFVAKVAHNGLAYGNGGLKIWPRMLLQTLRTHELDRRDTAGIDFAWNIPYVMAPECPTQTNVIATPYSAFRAGYREGVRLTMRQGQSALDAFPDLDGAAALDAHLTVSGRERLSAWCFRAPDTTEGQCALFGARRGCLDALIPGFDQSVLSDFDRMHALWRGIVGRSPDLDRMFANTLPELAEELALLGIRPTTQRRAAATRIGMLLPN